MERDPRGAGRLPGFFLAGAPKSGTTALYAYLGSHPNVFLAAHKEPHFFDAPEPTLSGGFDAYLDYFAGAGPEHRVVGEGSTGYLSSPFALETIRRLSPHARIAAVLRNPLELVQALHAEHCFQRFEDVLDLEEAWSLQAERRRGARLPATNPRGVQARMLQYESVGRLGRQVQRLLETFPREQVHLMLFDDLTRSPAECYAGLLEFLELPHDGRTDYPRINPRRRLRWPRLGRILAQPPRPVSAAVRGLKRRLGLGGRELLQPLRAVVDPLNEAPATPGPLSSRFRARLAAVFRSDVELLGELVGRDLAPWLH